MLTTKSNFWKWALPLIALSVALDQFVKAIVLNTPVFHARECLEPGATMRCGKIEMSSLLDWSMIWNYGVSYGLFQSDAIGNMIDRARFGAVVDYIDMSGPWFGITFPAESGLTRMLDARFFHADGVLGLGFPYVYNIADMSITFGAILLFADQLLAERAEKG